MLLALNNSFPALQKFRTISIGSFQVLVEIKKTLNHPPVLGPAPCCSGPINVSLQMAQRTFETAPGCQVSDYSNTASRPVFMMSMMNP